MSSLAQPSMKKVWSLNPYIILAQVHAVGVYQLLDNFVNLIVLIPFFPFTSRVNGNNAIGPLIMFQGAA